MDAVETPVQKKAKADPNYISDTLRGEVRDFAKDFKISWVQLGQHLYSIYRDKYYHMWGYDKFDQYAEQELGMKKSLCLKLLKSYIFIEQEEPLYTKETYSEKREAHRLPGVDEVNVLRLAKGKKDLHKDDYRKLKTAVFNEGLHATAARKELTSLIKERKQVDPVQEREERSRQAIQKTIRTLQTFYNDMSALKLIPQDVINETKLLMERLETHLP